MRRDGDAYFTPAALASRIVAELGFLIGNCPRPMLLEPCAGDGAFYEAMRCQWPSFTVDALDVKPQNDAIRTGDFLKVNPFSDRKYGAIIGNPPFILAEEFVWAALGQAEKYGYVAYLLRLSFLASKKRAALYRKHPLRYLMPICGRPSFTGDGRTDASEYGVMVWQAGFLGRGEILPPLEWR